MNGFTEHQTSEELSSQANVDRVLTLEQALSMLPLVQLVVKDLRECEELLDRLEMEKALLDSKRHVLDWPDRSRRYQLSEEITKERARCEQVRQELDQLGLALINPNVGQIGFPTIVNNRQAFFSWQLGEDSIQFWHFAQNLCRRLIPETWKQSQAA